MCILHNLRPLKCMKIYMQTIYIYTSIDKRNNYSDFSSTKCSKHDHVFCIQSNCFKYFIN